MRGLLFTGGNRPDMGIARHLFGEYDFVIAADSGLLGCEAAGLIPDRIVGDMDSLPDPNSLLSYKKESVDRWPHDKDLSDTELALSIMSEKCVDEVVLIGGSGGRLDHFFAIKSLFDRDFSPLVWIGEISVALKVDAASVKSGVRITGLSGTDPVSVFSVGNSDHHCRETGLYWPLDALDWNTGSFSLSNRCPGGVLELHASLGRFLVIVPLTPAIRITWLSADF